MSDWLGALIGAAERIGTRLLAKKPAKDNRILQTVNWAKQAGIHPLVALQGGFSGGYSGEPSRWSTEIGLGEALGSMGDYFMERNENQLGEDRYDRRRSEDRNFEREMQRVRSQPTAQDSYYEQLIKESQARTKNLELEHARMGATTGHNSMGGTKPDLEGYAAPASEVQQEYDDWVSGPYGVGKFIQQEWLDPANGWVDSIIDRYNKGTLPFMQ